MKRFISTIALVGVILWSGLVSRPVFAQFGELDQIMENAEQKTPSADAIPEKTAPSARDADWFSRQIEAGGASEAEKKWAEEMKKFAGSPEKQQIQGMKDLILKKFGINIFEGPVDGGPKYKEASAHWKGAPWKLEQLQTIYEALGNLPPDFIAHTKRINKFEQDTSEVSMNGKTTTITSDSFGVVHWDTPDMVNLFDCIFNNPKYSGSEKGQSKLKAVLIHEMTHCLQLSDLNTALGQKRQTCLITDWNKTFWVKAIKYLDGPLYPLSDEHAANNVEGIFWTAMSAEGYWERGQCVSMYGGTLQRKAKGLPHIRIGMEDMAEACSFYACAPDLMKPRFPKRSKFVSDHLLKNLGPNSSVPDINFNPRWYGFSETTITWAPPSGGLGASWADIGVAGSFPEKYPDSPAKVEFFVNEEEAEVNTLNDKTSRYLKNYAEVVEATLP
jgi:hypothetical protein